MKILSTLARDYPKASYVKTMMGQVKQHFGKKDEAAEYYEQAMLENRSNPILLLKLANARRAGGKLDRAIKYYREVLTLTPEDPTLTAAQVGLGICLVQKDPENGEGRKLLEDAMAKNMSDNLAAEAREALENARLGKKTKN